MIKATLMPIAEARVAVEYLMRAEAWAAEVDADIMGDMVLIRERLLRKIESLRSCQFNHDNAEHASAVSIHRP
jgi:hypothetical protein